MLAMVAMLVSVPAPASLKADAKTVQTAQAPWDCNDASLKIREAGTAAKCTTDSPLRLFREIKQSAEQCYEDLCAPNELCKYISWAPANTYVSKYGLPENANMCVGCKDATQEDADGFTHYETRRAFCTD